MMQIKVSMSVFDQIPWLKLGYQNSRYKANSSTLKKSARGHCS